MNTITIDNNLYNIIEMNKNLTRSIKYKYFNKNKIDCQ